MTAGPYGRLSAKEVVLSNCGVEEDSWETLGLQGDQTSQTQKKLTLNIHWKDCCWRSNPLATWCEQPTHWKRPWCWERLKAKGEGVTEDEMVRQYQHSMDMHLRKVRKIMKDRGAWLAAVHGVPMGHDLATERQTKPSSGVLHPKTYCLPKALPPNSSPLGVWFNIWPLVGWHRHLVPE